MIIKERDPREHAAGDPLAMAGAKAEDQMAFYLRRAFYQSKDVLVFNDLRFEDDSGDVAQFDHLILHKYGFVIVESKSVTSGIRVNQEGEWTRLWNNRPQGMPSPVLQAQRQITFLKRALDANVEVLTGKLLGLVQKRFGGYMWDVMVAISDQGTIKRDIEVPELCKADQITGRIEARIAELKKKSLSLAVFTDPVIWMDEATISNLSKFFIDHHSPKTSQRKPEVLKQSNEAKPSLTDLSAAKPMTNSAVTKPCPKCGGTLVIRTAKKGDHANKTFWGCSTFPKCRYNESIGV